jgi:hypothetical protein
VSTRAGSRRRIARCSSSPGRRFRLSTPDSAAPRRAPRSTPRRSPAAVSAGWRTSPSASPRSAARPHPGGCGPLS